MIVPAREPEPQPRRLLNGLSDVRAFFHNNTVPLYFISPTPFNLLGIYRWIRNFFYLTYYDSFEGEHSRVFVPRRRDRRDFDGMGDVCNHLLRDPETLEFIKNRGPGGKACFVMLDEETQALARQAGLEVMHPPAELRHRLESKIVMTRLADEAGVPSVPHVIGRVSSYDELSALAHGAGLGDDLVVEAAYGNAGSATFFVRGLRDWDQCAGGIVGQPEIKVMKRIRNVEVCIEATVTRHGTVIGPAMTSLVGYPELTPYRGAWCGNDVWRGALPPAARIRCGGTRIVRNQIEFDQRPAAAFPASPGGQSGVTACAHVTEFQGDGLISGNMTRPRYPYDACVPRRACGQAPPAHFRWHDRRFSRRCRRHRPACIDPLRTRRSIRKPRTEYGRRAAKCRSLVMV